MIEDILLLLGMLAGGALAGHQAWRAPLSGWAALAFSLVLAPLGLGLGWLFC